MRSRVALRAKTTRNRWRFAAILAQGGEFAFVVFTLAATNGLIDPAQRDLLILVVTLSMAATPLLVRARAEIACRSRRRPNQRASSTASTAPRRA